MASRQIYIKKKDKPLYEEADSFCNANDMSFSELMASLLKERLKKGSEDVQVNNTTNNL